MKSPFPGMDPYIEASGLWEDFHNHLIDAIYRAVARALPRGYTATTGARTYVVLLEENGKADHLAKPDVAVTEPRQGKGRRKKAAGATLADPAEYADSVAMQA